MGSISFQVVGDASVGTRAKTYSVPDEHINRLVACLKDGDPDMTTTAALLLWAESMMTATRHRVLQHERERAAIPPFEAT